MATELVLLGTAGAPLPVAGRGGISAALVQGASLLVHHVADLGYLERHGLTGAALARQAGLHTDVTQVGGVAERARVRELVLTHYLPADPGAVTDQEWAERAGKGFSGITAAGRDGLRRTVTPILRDQHGPGH